MKGRSNTGTLTTTKLEVEDCRLVRRANQFVLIVKGYFHPNKEAILLFPLMTINIDHAPVCILTSPDRDLSPAGGSVIPPTPNRPSKWNLTEFGDLLRAEGFNLEFIGWTASDNVKGEKKTILAAITNDALGKQKERARQSIFAWSRLWRLTMNRTS